MADKIMENKEKNQILFHGASNLQFEHKKKQGFYYGRRIFDDYTTEVTLDLMSALREGTEECKVSYYKQNSAIKQDNAIPVLLAIDAERYKKEDGIGELEIEIIGQILLKDVTLIQAIDKLLEVHPSAKKEELDFFKQFYLR